MTKNHTGRRRRKNSKHYESDDENGSDNGGDNSNGNGNGNFDKGDGSNSKANAVINNKNKNSSNSNNSNSNSNNKNLSFAEKRDFQRKAAAEKRRQKMKCYLCGKTGHVRKECPGISDDGRGESKYTKSNGDAGSAHLKQPHKGGRNSNNHHTKKKHNNNSSSSSSNNGNDLGLPAGFEREQQQQRRQQIPTASRRPPFLYYDAGLDEGRAFLGYLRFGRHGHGGNTKSNKKNAAKNSHGNHHTKGVSEKDAVAEYDTAMNGVCEATNFGGCIARSYLPPPSNNKNEEEEELVETTTPSNRSSSSSCDETEEEQSWNPRDDFPFSWSDKKPSLLKFVIGYRIGSGVTNDDGDTTTTTATSTDDGDATRESVPDTDTTSTTTTTNCNAETTTHLDRSTSSTTTSDEQEAIIDRLVETANHHKDEIVGFFADLDYTSLDSSRTTTNDNDTNAAITSTSTSNGCFRASQLQRLRNTLKAASRVDRPLQIRISPGYKPCQQQQQQQQRPQSPATPPEEQHERNHHPSTTNNNNNSTTTETTTTTTTTTNDGYSQAIRDLGIVLLEASLHYSWKVHLSSWNGKAEHLVALSGAFSSSSSSSKNTTNDDNDNTNDDNDNDNDRKHVHVHHHHHKLCFGFDGSLGFSKASHLHESAFEVSPHRVVLETTGPGILPPIVAKHCGRNAFCHSGHLPFVAEELARHLAKNPRNHSNNTNTNNPYGNSGDEESKDNNEITAETVARWASATTRDLYGLA